MLNMQICELDFIVWCFPWQPGELIFFLLYSRETDSTLYLDSWKCGIHCYYNLWYLYGKSLYNIALLTRQLPSKDISLIRTDFRYWDSKNTNELSLSRETIPLIWTHFHCRKKGCGIFCKWHVLWKTYCYTRYYCVVTDFLLYNL
jgi:hypothetical protein